MSKINTIDKYLSKIIIFEKYLSKIKNPYFDMFQKFPRDVQEKIYLQLNNYHQILKSKLCKHRINKELRYLIKPLIKTNGMHIKGGFEYLFYKNFWILNISDAYNYFNHDNEITNSLNNIRLHIYP